MPRVSPKCDHRAAAHVVVPKKRDMSYVPTLNQALMNASDKTISRATTVNDQQIIYFRRAPKMPACLRHKNRGEIAENRTQMRNVLSDLAVNYENKLGKQAKKSDREVVASLKDLAATRHGDITVGDIKQPIDIMSRRLERMQKFIDVKNKYQSPPPSNSTSLAGMLRRFERMDEGQKRNLKKMLFPQAQGVATLKQDLILQEMQTLASMWMKNLQVKPSEIAKKFCEMPILALFVNAWMAARPDGENRNSSTTSDHHQFAWRRGMDAICSELKKNVFANERGSVSGKSSPASESNTPISPTGRPTFKPSQKNSTHKVQLHRKGLPSAIDETALEELIKKSKTPGGKLSTISTKPISPIADQADTNDDDSPYSPSFPHRLRKTESGVLEEQIIKFTIAQAKAEANAKIARMRLEALLQSRITNAANTASNNIANAQIGLIRRDNLQPWQESGFNHARERIMSVAPDKSDAIDDSSHTPVVYVDALLEQLLSDLTLDSTEASANVHVEHGSESEKSARDSLSFLTEAPNRSLQTVNRSSSREAMKFDEQLLLLYQAEPETFPITTNDSLLLLDDTFTDNAALSPGVLYLAEKEQTPVREKEAI